MSQNSKSISLLDDKMNFGLVKCPSCNKQIYLKRKKIHIVDSEYALLCTNKKCNSSFPYRDGYFNLLPTCIRNELCTLGQLKRKFHFSNTLNKNEQDLIEGILASKEMAKEYFKNVVHPTRAVWSARSYERFEDIFILEYLNSLLKDREVTFIEAGTGPGRYLLLLGSKIHPQAWKQLKGLKETSSVYRSESRYKQNLRYIIGIDYSEEMVRHSVRLLERYGLVQLLYRRIFPFVGVVQSFNLDVKMTKDTHKFVVCTFQTLGNQNSQELQVKLLKAMKKLALPRGTIMVSVFNKKLFERFGLSFYKREVNRTVGQIVSSQDDINNSVLRTDRGVYSKWFSSEDLKALFKKAKITNYDVMDESTLRPIEGYTDYLSVEEQKTEVFPRAIIGLAEVR